MDRSEALLASLETTKSEVAAARRIVEEWVNLLRKAKEENEAIQAEARRLAEENEAMEVNKKKTEEETKWPKQEL